MDTAERYFLAFSIWCDIHGLKWEPLTYLYNDPLILLRLEFTDGRTTHRVRIPRTSVSKLTVEQTLVQLTKVLEQLFS